MVVKNLKINIKYNRFLDPVFMFYCKNNPDFKKSGWNDWVVPKKEEVLKRVKNYKIAWKKDGEKMLDAVTNVTGLSFKVNIMDVHIVSGNPRQFSHPIIIKSGYSPDEFVSTLTHELIHELFSQNIDIVYISIFKDMFPEETKLTQSHIVVHAILKYLYIDVLKDKERLKKNIESSQKHSTSDYSIAWDMVEKIGYMELIREFKMMYKKPPTSN